MRQIAQMLPARKRIEKNREYLSWTCYNIVSAHFQQITATASEVENIAMK
jgi:hypothetical protein